MIYSYRSQILSEAMTTAIRRTISLPLGLARDIEAQAKAEGRSVSAVVQEALRIARAQRQKEELQDIQDYWSRKAKELGILSEKELERYLAE